MKTNFLKKIIQCKYNNTFLNVNSNNLNIDSSMIQTILYGKKKYILNVKYRIFGSSDIIKDITKKLDNIIDNISQYDMYDMSKNLKSQKSNIEIDKWLKSIIYNKSNAYKYNLNKYDIFVYYYSDKKSDHKLLDKTFDNLSKIILNFNRKKIIQYDIDEQYKHYKNFVQIIKNPIYISLRNINTKLQDDNNNLINKLKKDKLKKDKLNNNIKINSIKEQDCTNDEINKFIKDNNIKSTSKKLRYKLWYIHFKDKNTGNCYSCMDEIKLDNPSWHCGHICSNYNGGLKTIDNLHPICVKCNLDMKEQHMYRYIIYNNKKGIINLSDNIKLKYEKDNNKYKKIIYILDNINKKYKKMSIPSIKWVKTKLKLSETDEISNILKYIKSLNIKYNEKSEYIKSEKNEGIKLLEKLHTNKKINKDILHFFKLKLNNESSTTLKYIQTL